MTSPGVLGATLVVLGSVVVGLVVHRRGRDDLLPTLAVVAGLLLVVASTTLPTAWSAGTPAANFVSHPFWGGIGRAAMEVRDAEPSTGLVLFVLNVAVYVPLGAALAWRWSARAWPLVVPVVVSLGVEVVQYRFLGRVAATDDVVLNVAGAWLGWAMVRLLLPRVVARRRGHAR